MKLSGKTALVVGGGSGIGAAVAHSLAGEGCRVAIAGRNVNKLRDVAARFKGSPAIESHEVDVSDRRSVRALFDWAAKTLGPVHILINCAGVNIRQRSMAAMPPEEWDRLLAINVTGAYNCMHAVLPQMRERREGTIVNISSISGKRATTFSGVAYNASKFALEALTTAVANEENAHGIRVTSIGPGEVDTPILDNRPVAVTAEQRAKMLQPEDVAAAVMLAVCLPPRARVAEMILMPTAGQYV